MTACTRRLSAIVTLTALMLKSSWPVAVTRSLASRMAPASVRSQAEAVVDSTV